MSGTVNGGTECYIAADSVSVTGTQAVCAPLGMPGWVTAGGEFGLQSALYLNSVSGQSKVGAGLNAVGMNVKVWGKVTSTGTEGGKPFYYIDDGSGLKRGTQSGLKVVYWYGCTPPSISVGDYCSFTGILGAELSEDATPLPVPIVRVGFRDVIYVKPAVSGGNDSNSGLSWGEAKATVQNAVDTAYGMSSKPEVWVAAGTYLERITLKTGIALYGGFAGVEQYREPRNCKINVTTLDGGSGGTVVAIPSSVSSATIDGFTIRNGMAPMGGGINCTTSATTVTISNNVITSNTARGTSGYGYGGGIRCNNASPKILNNRVEANIAESVYLNYTGKGGGISCLGGSPIIANNLIVGNTATNGGALYCTSSSTATIVNNTMVDNTATYGLSGGGIFFSSTSALTISNNIIAFNSTGICKSGTGGTTTLGHNCVYGNNSYDYVALSAGVEDISVDPFLVDRANLDYHINPSSRCIDKGDDSAVNSSWRDIDGEPRMIDVPDIGVSVVDIGADESDGVANYDLTLTADPDSGLVNDELPVTATISGVSPLSGFTVHFTVTGGTLTEVNGVQLDPGTTSYDGLADSSGQAFAKVTRNSHGTATLTTAATRGADGTPWRSIELSFISLDDDWPMFMHDPQHTGASIEVDNVTTEDLTLVWSAPVPTASTDRDHWPDHPNPYPATATVIFEHPYIDSSPVHAVGCPVIVGAYSGTYASSTGYVVAYDPVDHTVDDEGIEVWRYPSSGTIAGVASTPAVFASGEETRVVFGSMDGKVYCLDATDGTLIWSYQTTNRAGTGNGAILASPTVDTNTGTVYIGNESSKFYALDGNTSNANGSLLWSADLPVAGGYNDRTGLSSAALATVGEQLRLYVGSDNGHVYCLSAEQSPALRVIWDYAGEDGLGLGCVESSPTICAGNVYVGTSWYQGIDLVALDADNGQLVWDKGLTEEVRSTCAVSDGHIFVGVDTGTEFYKLAMDNGDVSHTFVAGNYFVGSSALTSSDAGLVFVGNDNNNFYALLQSTLTDPQTGLPKAARNIGGMVCSSPSISYAAESSARWVYVVSRGDNGRGDGFGTLFAYRTQR